MKIVHITTEVYNDAGGWPATTEESKARHDKILADLNAPVYLHCTKKLDYDHKTDRYAATFFLSGRETMTLKATTEVAEFIAAHITESGYWLGRMADGALVDVYLIQQT